MPAHKKGHDKDKYYHLAKDQGYRSRAAFKLIQINKRFDFLSKAKVCIDLCAAPGGWCQVAAKYMPAGSLVLGVDLLQIRAIRNVKTMVADITTAECRRMVVTELAGWKADVVLCDGAPNIGSNYGKDAFVQNELVLAALKTATDHLVLGGTFCTKVYRSVDYNSIIWVLQQLFEDVQTMKPNSSRSQSSEIFLVCLKYTKPNFIDPKLLDPNHVFKEVADPGLKKVNVLHKKFEQHNKRQRSGYDEALGMTLSSKVTIAAFFATKEPVEMLTDVNQILFPEEEEEAAGEGGGGEKKLTYSQRILAHPKTSAEMISCLKDLKLLGKTDFKKILKWRMHVKNSLTTEDRKKTGRPEVEAEVMETDPVLLGLMSERAIQDEIAELRDRDSQMHRKEKKKDRREGAKERQRQYLGMSGASFGVAEDVELFNIGERTSQAQLDAMRDVNLDDLDHFPSESESEQEQEQEEHPRARGQRRGAAIEVLEEDLEQELELAYNRFLAARQTHSRSMERGAVTGKSRLNAGGVEVDGQGDALTVSAKRARRGLTSEAQLASLEEEDEALLRGVKGKKETGEVQRKEDMEQYVNLLTKSQRKREEGKEGEGVSESSSDNDSDDEEEEEEEEEEGAREGVVKSRNGMAVSRDGLSSAGKAAKWFANPIFGNSMVTGDDAEPEEEMEVEEVEEVEVEEVEVEVKGGRKRKQREEEGEKVGFQAMDELMPKTDKQVRKEQRKKDVDRRERRALKSTSKGLTEEEEDMPLRAGGAGAPGGDLIQRGVGKKALAAAKVVADMGFEIVPAEAEASATADEIELLRRKDARSYDSDEDEFDAHDRSRTLALGTMMLRHSKKKALVDASYNRFAWNDPRELPAWFTDDEARHNKPQLPVPAALLEQIKSRFQTTGTKEIKKVAEARMRKRKRAAAALKAAKKSANTLAESSEISERQKLKAITKAMRSQKTDKPSKVYVVTKKTQSGSMGTSQGGKGKMKFVDKRMRNDTRAQKRNEKRGPKKKRS